jgi:hypothetical protein
MPVTLARVSVGAARAERCPSDMLTDMTTDTFSCVDALQTDHARMRLAAELAVCELRQAGLTVPRECRDQSANSAVVACVECASRSLTPFRASVDVPERSLAVPSIGAPTRGISAPSVPPVAANALAALTM